MKNWLPALSGRLGLGHRDRADLVLPGSRRFVDDRVAGPTGAGGRRVAALHHEVRDDAVTDRVVEVLVAGEEHEVVRGNRRGLGIDGDRELALVGRDDRFVRHPGFQTHRRWGVELAGLGVGAVDRWAVGSSAVLRLVGRRDSASSLLGSDVVAAAGCQRGAPSRPGRPGAVGGHLDQPSVVVGQRCRRRCRASSAGTVTGVPGSSSSPPTTVLAIQTNSTSAATAATPITDLAVQLATGDCLLLLLVLQSHGWPSGVHASRYPQERQASGPNPLKSGCSARPIAPVECGGRRKMVAR